MTAPVAPAGPAVRGPSTGGAPDAGGAESATPFASALDGALAEGRGAVDDGEAQDSGSPAATVVPPDAATTGGPVTVDLAAALFALALGTSQATAQQADSVFTSPGTTVPALSGGPVAAAAPVAAPSAPPALPVPGTTPATTAAGDAEPAAVSPALTGNAAPTPAAGLPLDVVTGPAGRVPAAPGAPGTAPAQAGPSLPTAGVLAALPPAVVETAAVTSAVAAATSAAAATTPVPVAAGADPAVPGTPVPAGTGVPVTSTASSAGADTGAAGHDTGAAPSDGGTAEPVPGSVTGPAPTASARAAADTDGATGTAASLPVAGQVARQVAVLRGAPDGSHTMTLVLTPETLGPVEVSVTVTKGTVDLVLRGAHEQGRAALLDALPDLRRDLETAGLVTSKLEVAKESGGSWLDRHAAGQQAQQGFGERPGQHGPADGRSRPWQRPADSGETRTIPTTGSASSGVDVRV